MVFDKRPENRLYGTSPDLNSIFEFSSCSVAKNCSMSSIWRSYKDLLKTCSESDILLRY